MENTINIRKNQKKMDTYTRQTINHDVFLAEEFVEKIKQILKRLSN